MSSESTTTGNAPADAHEEHKAFGRTYWMLNSIEMFERLAYFGIRAVVPLYIMQATEPGGLHLTAMHKGTIYAWWAILQSFLPIITGGIADRYGYKKVLFFAICANALGYVMMANLHSYYGFFASVLVLASGTAFFKPSLQGSLAQSLTKENSSLGWGVFYWVVNVGAFGAPIMSTLILGKPHSAEGWQTLFYVCAGFTCCNLLILPLFKDVPSGASKTESTLQVLKRTLVNILEPRLIIWLLIMSCFWLMMYQLWDLHPNFITDWVDSSAIAAHAPEMWQEYGDRGLMQVPQQILLNINAALIILLMVPLSWAARKMRTLSAMVVGMSVATCGVLIAGLTDSGWVLMLGIVFFSLGEMWTGPKKNEYLGLIAPPGKKGLYLGYVNIPVGIGVFVGSYMAGYLYDNYGEKASLALKELATQPKLVARAAQAIDWSDSLDKLPELLKIERDQAFTLTQQHLGEDADTTADTLRSLFRYDSGQITNLGYHYLAYCPEYRDAVKAGLAAELRRAADDLNFEASEKELDGASQRETLLAKATELRRQAAEIETGPVPVEGFVITQYGHEIPKWVGKKRLEVLEIVRELVNRDRPSDKHKNNAAIARMLWSRFGYDRVVLDNLSLEYLAQGTNRLRDAVEKMTFKEEVKQIVKQIEETVGIGRTKSFEALASALGAPDAVIDETIAEDGASGVFDYLVKLPHRRFITIARRDWKNDVPVLRGMIESDAAAKAIVDEKVWELSTWEKVKSLFWWELDKEHPYRRLAENNELIQDALDEKDWSQTPDQAAQLLGLNPFEARSLAAAEVNNSALAATKLLWNNYHPQYRVWLPFAAIGVLATIALGVFGQMAKRWKDMDA